MAFYVLYVPFFATPVLSGSAQRVLSQTEMFRHPLACTLHSECKVNNISLS